MNNSVIRRAIIVMLFGLPVSFAAAQSLPQRQPLQMDRRPPGPAPANVIARAIDPMTIVLTWNPVPGATGYTVVRDPSTGPVMLTPQPITTTSFTHIGVKPRTAISYIVSANFRTYAPGKSTVVSATTPPAPQPTEFRALASPAKVDVVKTPPPAREVVSPGQVTLNWNAASGASGYLLHRTDDVFLNNKQLIRATQYTDQNVPPGTYVYTLIAYYKVEGMGEVQGEMNTVPRVAARVAKRYGPFYVCRTSDCSIQTGVAIRKGSLVEVQASGKIDFGSGVPATLLPDLRDFWGLKVQSPGSPILGPDGDDWQTPSNYPAPNLRKNSLICKVGSIFYQGGTQRSFRPTDDGELILRPNDAWLQDNRGEWAVTVIVTEP